MAKKVIKAPSLSDYLRAIEQASTQEKLFNHFELHLHVSLTEKVRKGMGKELLKTMQEKRKIRFRNYLLKGSDQIVRTEFLLTTKDFVVTFEYDESETESRKKNKKSSIITHEVLAQFDKIFTGNAKAHHIYFSARKRNIPLKNMPFQKLVNLPKVLLSSKNNMQFTLAGSHLTLSAKDQKIFDVYLDTNPFANTQANRNYGTVSVKRTIAGKLMISKIQPELAGLFSFLRGV